MAISEMEAVEKPDLHASAAQIVGTNSFGVIALLSKEIGFGRFGRCHVPKLPVFVSASIQFGSAGIFLGRQLRYLHVSPVARFAYDFVRGAPISQYQTGFQFGELGITRLLQSLGADCLHNLFCGGRSRLLCGAYRQAPGLEVQ